MCEIKKLNIKCWVLIIAFIILFFPAVKSNAKKSKNNIIKKFAICYNNAMFKNKNNSEKGIVHKTTTRWLNGKPAIVNIITVNPQLGDLVIKPTYGEYVLNDLKRVKEFALKENAVAAINASFFKPDIGAPLGVSIINNEILTGPIFRRVVLGINDNNEFLMDRLDIKGKINIGKDIELQLVNYNQPVFSKEGYTIFTDRWGKKTPFTSTKYCHVVVVNNRVKLVKQSSVDIPKKGYALVGPRNLIKGLIDKGDSVKYSMKIGPEKWKKVKYAVGGGPYLVKNGEIFTDRQMFTNKFLWRKEPRTAIGYTRAGTLILVTVDGRRRGVSEGATIKELAKIMWELGAYNDMNLDGGSSTQMVYNGKLVNVPTLKGGSRVTNALIVVPACLNKNQTDK